MATDNKIIEKLKDDKHYYGEYGQQWISNSDISTLKDDPKSWRAPEERTLTTLTALEQGRYFHQLLLEPTKAKDFPQVEVSTRNVTEYKQYLKDNNLEFALKKSEAKEIEDCVDWIMNEKTECTKIIRELFSSEEKLTEQPAICTLLDHEFKGKADLITKESTGQFIVVDFKTTKKNLKQINKYMMRDFGYSTQAYLYQELFGMPFIFVFIGKNKKYLKNGEVYYDVMLVTPSKETIQEGKAIVEGALVEYDKFYREGAEHDIAKAIIIKTI